LICKYHISYKDSDIKYDIRISWYDDISYIKYDIYDDISYIKYDIYDDISYVKYDIYIWFLDVNYYGSINHKVLDIISTIK